MKTRLRAAGAWLAAGCAVMVVGGLTGAGQAPPQFGVQTDREVDRGDDREEKVGLVVGIGMRMPGLPAEMQGPAVGATQTRRARRGRHRRSPSHGSGFPSIVLADGPAGAPHRSPSRDGDPSRTYYCTAFPIATLLASTWDVGVPSSASAGRWGTRSGNTVST